MTKEELLKDIKKILLFKTVPKTITQETLLNDLHMDKFDLAVLRRQILIKYNIKIPSSEYSQWQTINDILEYLMTKLS